MDDELCFLMFGLQIIVGELGVFVYFDDFVVVLFDYCFV